MRDGHPGKGGSCLDSRPSEVFGRLRSLDKAEPYLRGGRLVRRQWRYVRGYGGEPVARSEAQTRNGGRLKVERAAERVTRHGALRISGRAPEYDARQSLRRACSKAGVDPRCIAARRLRGLGAAATTSSHPSAPSQCGRQRDVAPQPGQIAGSAFESSTRTPLSRWNPVASESVR